MQYANTVTHNGVEIVATILPLTLVPGFDPANPPQAATYGVPDDVQVGWIKQGGVFVAPPLPVATVPYSVTALQGLLAIDQSGLASAYETWANDPARTFAQKAFINKAQTWKRDDPTLIAAATALGLTSGQMDAMFTLGKTL